MKQARVRADALLVERGLAPSRTRAQALILAGHVRTGEQRVSKSGDLLPADAPLSVIETMPYVSRGGLKLASGLDRFGVDPAGRRCLDAGASTGGFTDCLLQRGAAHVIAVDVGHGQLDIHLRRDSRVTVLEGVNARELEPAQVGEPPTLVTCDVAFISLAKVLPALVSCAPAAEMVLLVKPQFEAGRGKVGKGGVVRDPATWREVLVAVDAAVRANGLQARDVMASPLTGPAGNREFLLHAQPASGGGGVPLEPELIERALAEAATTR